MGHKKTKKKKKRESNGTLNCVKFGGGVSKTK